MKVKHFSSSVILERHEHTEKRRRRGGRSGFAPLGRTQGQRMEAFARLHRASRPGVKMDTDSSWIGHLPTSLLFVRLAPLCSGKAEVRPRRFSGRVLFGGLRMTTRQTPRRGPRVTDGDELSRPGRVRIPARGARESRGPLRATALRVVYPARGPLSFPKFSAAEQTPERAAGPLLSGGRRSLRRPGRPRSLRRLVGAAHRRGLRGPQRASLRRAVTWDNLNLEDATAAAGMSPHTGYLW